MPRRTQRNSILCLIFLLGLLPPRIEAQTFVLTILPYDEECFLFRTPGTLKTMKFLTGNFELIDDEGINADPLLVYVMEATRNEKIIYRSNGQATGSFRVPVKPGNGYWMCLQNSNHAPDNQESEPEHPDHKTRMVGFTYTLRDIHERPAPLAFSEDNSSDWMQKSAAVEEELKMLVSHHEYLQVREAKHRSVVEQTFSSLLFWSVLEALLVILGAVGQVMYFRRFLEKKRFL